MRKLKLIALLTLYLMVVPTTKAYWGLDMQNVENVKNISFSIGSWAHQSDTTPWDNWNLNVWQDENILNQTIPDGQLFTYNGTLYISIDSDYNPFYHGLPDVNPIPWAYVATDLHWRPGTNYRVNSVVIREGRYFIANSNYTTDDWFVNDPIDFHGHLWSEWREIEPISEEHFNYFIDTNIRDFANPNWNYIIYK